MPGRRPLLWLGMGASHCAGLAGALLATLRGRASLALEASEWLHHGRPAAGEVEGPILVSTSGESAEIVSLLEAARDRGGILVSNSEGSPCWRLATLRFPILAGPERANATKTYTSSTAACLVLASEISGHRWEDDSRAVIETYAESLHAVFRRRAELQAFAREARSWEFIGRGGALPGAIMGALCVREMTGIRAVAHSGGAFRHGPNLDVDSSHLAVIPALGRTAELGRKLAAECAERGGRVILVVAEELGESRGILSLRVSPVPEPWESLTSVLVAQALTLGIIERIGSSYVRVQTTTE